MADSYSVKAILSATDKGFTSTLKNALGTVDSLANKVKSGFAFGILTGMGQQAFSALSNGARELVGEVNSANKAWKTYEGNMQILGKSEAEIAKVKGSLQKFAEASIYSSSDMASTYAQLASVGTKSADTLVTGFGGLAAAAVNPTQAMKTLSQQAVQMAAKPKVQWMDFKLMLEQTPAGMAAVAKQMGKTSAELVADIQAGEVTTEEFFDAINKVGNSDSFQKLATSYKGVDEAMAGLKETVGNKLTPAFDLLSQKAISGISGIIDKVSAIDGEGLADKVSGWIKKAQPMWNSFTKAVSKVATVVAKLGAKAIPIFTALKTKAAGAVKSMLDKIGSIDADEIVDKVCGWAKKAQPMWNSFTKAVSKVRGVLSGLGKSVLPALAKMFTSMGTKAAGAIQSMLDKVASIDVNAVVDKICGWAKKAQPYIDLFTSAISTIAGAVSAALPYIIAFASAVGSFFLDHSDTIAKCIPYVIGLVAAYKGFKVVKAVVPGMVSFASSIAKMAAGGIKGLAAKLFSIAGGQKAAGKAAATSSKQMLASAKAFLMIGAGVLMVAAGFALLAQSAIALSNAGGLAIGIMAGLVIAVAGLTIGMMAMMKTVTASPKKLTSMATAMLALGAAVLMIGAGFALMAQSSIALANAGGLAIGVMVGMVAVVALLAVGAAALGTALTAGAIGFITFGAAIALVGAGALLAATALRIVSAALPAIVANGTAGAVAIAALGAGMMVFAAGAALAGAAAVILGAGLLVAAVGIAVAGVAIAVLGAGILALSAGALIAAASIALVSVVLPQVAAYGQQGAAALAALSGGLVVFASGAAVAGAAALVLGAGLVVVGAGIALISAGVLAAAAGVIALGAGALVLAAALALCGASTTLLGATLPLAASGATAATAAFAAMLAASAGLAGSLVLVEAPLALIAATAAVSTVAIAAFDVAMLAGSVSALAMAAALKSIKSSMKTIANSAKTAESSLDSMQSSVSVVESGLNALGSKAREAMSQIKTAFSDTADDAQSSGQKVGQGFTEGMQSGLAQAPIVARQMTTSVSITLMGAYSATYRAGAYISQGFAAGMLSMMGVIEAAAARMAAAASKALAAAAQIKSPSRVTMALGEYYGEGWIVGIKSKVKDSWKAAENLVTVPNIKAPALAGAYGGEMSAEYDYYRNAEYVIVVPLNLDGKEVARATAPYTQSELNRRTVRESRKQGKV